MGQFNKLFLIQSVWIAAASDKWYAAINKGKISGYLGK